ncbi:MAG: leucine-rich repeat domain-containing protein [Marinilabiliaceae bacterium]|nr:leucine-rich repeat domain-containing protein [Marinilabiliaceae bacterium]
MIPNIDIKVSLSSEVRFEQALKEAGVDDAAYIWKLSIIGELTDDDFCYIRENMAKTLQEVDLGKSLFFFYGAFDDFISLKSITVHPENPEYASENGILFSKDMTILIRCPQGKEGDYVVPDSVNYIRGGAFWKCSGLTSIIIPDSVREIMDAAFYYCTGLKSVTIPQAYYGIKVFSRCTGLVSIHFSSSVTEIPDGIFPSCTSLISIDIPESVKYIGRSAFWGCTALVSVFIPASVTIIKIGAFDDCPAYFTVHPDNPVYKSKNGKLTKRIEPSSQKIEKTKNINKYGFEDENKNEIVPPVYINIEKKIHFWNWLIVFVDEMRLTGYIKNVIEHDFGCVEYNAMFAGVVEYLSNEIGVAAPVWVYNDKFTLKQPYFFGDYIKSDGMRKLIMSETPQEFKCRNIFLGANTFDRF